MVLRTQLGGLCTQSCGHAFLRHVSLVEGKVGDEDVDGFFFFLLWATPRGAQGLLLALHSGIIPDGAWGILWVAGVG